MTPTETSPEPSGIQLDWDAFLAWLPGFFRDVGLRAAGVVLIIAICLLLAWLLRFVIRRIVRRIVSGAKSKARVDDTQALDRSPLAAVRLVQRTRTLGTILTNIVNTALLIVALVLVVNTVAPDALGSLTLLTAAIGAGLGFGAQNIVKDVLNGIFIVAEDQIGIGDVVDLGLATGVVEYVSVRVTHVRDVNGTLWYVRNGEILRIGNMSQGWSRIIVDVAVPRESSLENIEKVVMSTANALAGEPKWRSRIVDKPELWGLESVDGDTMVVRVVMKTRSTSRDDVARELRTRLRAALMAADIPATLTSVQLSGNDGAQRVRGANPPKTKPTTVSEVPETQVRPTWRPKSPGETPEQTDGQQELPE